MFWIGYRFLMTAFLFAVNIKSAWDDKAAKFLHGRLTDGARLQSILKVNDYKLIQIHCASLGEFELSLPLYHSLLNYYPDHKFLFTFFSPSGYEYAKIPEGSFKSYLPFDKRGMVNKFLDATNIQFVIFIKYEFWFEFLDELSIRKIPFGFVNINQQKATANLKFKKAKEIISKAAFICTSNKNTSDVLKSVGLKTAGPFSDLRFSQSFRIQNENYKLHENIKSFFHSDNTIICGSIWKEDLDIIIPLIDRFPNWNWVLAPHDVNQENLDYLNKNLDQVSFFSEDKIQNQSKILILDTIGDLKYLYKFGNLNYVGGAFKTGLHNVLEPLYAGAPIVFGPKYEAFPEAISLIEQKLGMSISNTEEFAAIIQNLENGSLHLVAPKKMELIKSELKELTELVARAYEPRS